jgi:LPS-assembly lipoprotein
MSWSDGIRRFGASAFIATTLSACGFHPLYAENGTDPALEPRLASIRVEQMSDRSGQELTNELRDALNPHALSIAATYRLTVALTQVKTNLAVRQDNTASRTDTNVAAEWSLRRIDGGDVLVSGTARSLGSHDVLENEYANVVSGNADLERALRDVSQQIETRLALYFRKHK